MRSHDNDIVTLRDAHSVLSAAPFAGGRLMRWSVSGRDVIHWPATFDLTQAAKIRGGNPLLFPFVGRHRVGDTPNEWQDATGAVHALPQHGFARDLPFVVHAQDPQSITMQLSSSAITHAGYPFDFVFQVRYTIDGNALRVELDTRNTGDVPMPYYAGHHFYFHLPYALRAESRLHLPPTLRCAQAPDGGITTAQAEPSEYAPGDPAIQDRFHVLVPDLDLGKRPSPITLHTPTLARRITMELDDPASVPWYAITTWTESDESDFYCIEPWLGLPNAIHHGQGLRWIAPGASEIARCRIVVRFDD